MIFHANCLDVLEAMDENTLDALVTDPPYGLGFMGRAWDKALPDPRIWRECLRAMKPGAHGVVFGAPRLYHRLACQVEDAGFEVRDVLMWMFGSGFPKGGNVTDEHGILLKPAYEPILLVRKPLRGTVAENVLAYGTGCLNIGACRVEGVLEARGGTRKTALGQMNDDAWRPKETPYKSGEGRWPANVILDEAAGAILDEQSGASKSRSASGVLRNGRSGGIMGVVGGPRDGRPEGHNDEGGASRFFYCAKASRAEREAGLESLDAHTVTDGRKAEIDNPYQRGATERRNTHPTVKPIALMRYLVRLIAPEGGTVFDPFTGSGSTGVACALEGVDFLGAELEAEYVRIAEARIARAKEKGCVGVR